VEVLGVGRHDPKTSPLVALQSVLAHQAADALFVDRLTTLLADLRRHATPPVAPSMSALAGSNLLDQLLVLMRSLGGRAHACGVESAARD